MRSKRNAKAVLEIPYMPNGIHLMEGKLRFAFRKILLYLFKIKIRE